MYLITATFEAEAAIERTRELFALSDSPERLAERLGIPRDLEMVKLAVGPSSFKQLVTDITKLRQFLGIEKQIEEVRAGKTMYRFLGNAFQEKQITKLEDERRKFGSLIEAPLWFYKQPRVQLLSAIRDYALDGSQQGDASWTEVEEETLVFPIAQMFENADLPFAQDLVTRLEKPLKDFDPQFLLEKLEGNRSISFDFEKNVVFYYTPAPAH